MNAVRGFISRLASKLDGGKSYAVLFAGFVYKLLVTKGVVAADPTIEAALVALFLAALRSALKKIAV